MSSSKVHPVRVPTLQLAVCKTPTHSETGQSLAPQGLKVKGKVIPVSEADSRLLWRMVKRLCVCFRPRSVKVLLPTFSPRKLRFPKVSAAAKGKKSLVLDLDETLVHSTFHLVESPDAMVAIPTDNGIAPVFVTYRPGLRELLSSAAQLYEIIIFTASIPAYANPLLDILDSECVIERRFFRESCKKVNETYQKDLRLLGRDMSTVVIVDNCPDSYSLQPANAIPISSFFGDRNDKELFKLIPLLEELAQAADVRDVIRPSLDMTSSCAHIREGDSSLQS